MHGLISVLMLDYDLGVVEPKNKRGKKGKSMGTGYDVLMYAIINNLLPDTVQLVTSNPAGRKRMHDALIHDAKYIKRGVNYMKAEPEEIVK